MNDPRQRFLKTEGIVLKQANIGEGDRIITMYTPTVGKLRAVARGIRKVKSKLAGHLEPLTRCQVLVHRGSSSLESISQSEALESNLALRQDLPRLSAGVYLAELVERFTTEGQENRQLYELFQACLVELATAKNVALLLRYFEMRLLGLTGFEPELGACVECRTALDPAALFFSPSAGGVLCATCREGSLPQRSLSLNALKVLRLLAQGDYVQVRTLRVSEGLAVELEGLIRQYIRYLLEQELKSTEFLDLVRRQLSGPETGHLSPRRERRE